MSKRTIIIFAVAALVLGVGVPWWAIDREGDGNEALQEEVTVTVSNAAQAKTSFRENCGTCHVLRAAGADGVVGPNLDQLLVGNADQNRERTLNAINRGINGRMPAGILRGTEAEQVAKFVAQAAGR